MRAVLLVFLGWIGSAGASYFFVTAPSVLRFNHDETVVINTFGSEKNVRVEVWLEIKEKKFSGKIKTISNEGTPQTTTVKVTEKDLQIGDDGKRPTAVYLYAKTNKGTFNRKLLLSYDSGYILVQTTKPLYHPNEKVTVRALAMTETLQYAKGFNISMDIISPSNLTFGRRRKEDDEHHFFEHSFLLPPKAEEGLWTIRAFYEGQYRTEGRASFQVLEYVLPTFGVTVEVNEKVITDTTESIDMLVRARYVYDKPVNGKAVIKMSCIDDNGNVTDLANTITRVLEADGSKAIKLEEDGLSDLKRACGGFPKLNGQRLLIKARVIESATGKEEEVSNKSAVFSDVMYKFSFDRSKNNYRPGLSYYLRITVKLANGDSPKPIQVTSRKASGDEHFVETTDDNGNVLMVFSTPKKSNQPIVFEVQTERQKTTFTVQPYAGSDQIHVNQLIRENGEMTIQSIVQGIGKTGVLYLIFSRGQYIHHIYFKASTEQERIISNKIQDMISPEARVVAFFVSQNGRLVADSTKFTVTPKCRGKGLELDPKRSFVHPDDRSKLTITGTPNMTVGLNIMDKALLLLDSDNVLRKSKMFKLMRSHDLGCGEGGGVNVENVFHDAGVTVVTNVGLNSASLDRESMECKGRSRRKRSDDCYGSLPGDCCSVGHDFAIDVVFDYFEKEDEIDVYTKCYGRTLLLANQKKNGLNRYSTACLKAHFLTCMEVLYQEIEDLGLIGKSAGDGANDYLAALNEFGIDEIPVRKNFRDSWLFKTVNLDGKGQSDEIELGYPSSLTTWMIQAVGITEDQGFCIAEPKNVTAFKPAFIQLDMPFKTSRLEYFDLKVTVFNYKEDSEAKIKLFIAPVDGLCMGADDPNENMLIKKIDLKGNEAYSVRVPILPLRAERFPIKVSLLGRAGQEQLSDSIEKHLLVVNEGIEEREAITVCLNPNNRKGKLSDCVDDDRVIDTKVTNGIQTKTINMTVPGNALIGTGSAYAYATSNVMDDIVRTVISGIDNMLRKPIGCGEQTMLFLGPTVYVMSYWKNTKQMNKAREEQGNTWIRNGVKRELTFRKSNGSYGAWLDRDSSTWLTAFVGKVFCQANKVVDGVAPVDIQQNVVKTLEWLTGTMDKATGAFRDNKPVIHREMIGQIKERDPSLTAFVLITLLECDVRTPILNDAKAKAVRYLEKISDFTYKRNPYLLAISTYALAKAGSRKKFNMKNMLLGNSLYDRIREFRHWGHAGGHPASKDAVETTAYAMLALMEFPNEFGTVGQVVRWLTHQRNAAGSFRTTQDTVIGLQALSEYTIMTFSAKVKLDIKLNAAGWAGRSQTLTNKNRYLLETIKDIPVKEGEQFLSVVTSGVGSGKLVIDYRYNRPESPEEKCAFEISDIEIGDVDDDVDIDVGVNFGRQCDICGCVDNKNKDIVIEDIEGPVEIKPKMSRRKREAGDNEKERHCVTFTVSSRSGRDHGMSIIDVGLETGMQVIQADLDKMKENGLIDMYEMPGSDKGFFILYVDTISPEPVEFKFRLEEQFEVEKSSRQPSRIHVYDYYKPEYECTKFYGTGPNGGSPVKYDCVDDSMPNTCSCLKSVCPDANQVETLYQSRKVGGRKPAKDLYNKICGLREATFAIELRVTGIKPDPDKQIRVASAEVVKVIHKGTDQLEERSEISLYWRMYCEKDLVEVGKRYYLISTDGEKYESTDGTTMYKYQLMGDATIVEWDDIRNMERGKRKFVQQMMRKFTQLMQGGCKL